MAGEGSRELSTEARKQKNNQGKRRQVAILWEQINLNKTNVLKGWGWWSGVVECKGEGRVSRHGESQGKEGRGKVWGSNHPGRRQWQVARRHGREVWQAGGVSPSSKRCVCVGGGASRRWWENAYQRVRGMLRLNTGKVRTHE